MPAKKTTKKNREPLLDFTIPASAEAELRAENSPARRFSPDTKLIVLRFIEHWDAAYGRGGASEVKRRWGITPGTVLKWQADTGSKTVTPKQTSFKATTRVAQDLRHAAELTDNIEKLRTQLKDLEARRAKVLKRVIQS